MRSLDLCFVVGARPNFVKAAPVVKEAARRGIAYRLIHTGQHSDDRMSGVFLRDLEMPAPDLFLTVGATTHAGQTAEIMVGVEDALLKDQPRCVVVFGDVNSTLAASLAASKLGIPIAHVEAGLRSRDRTMPEEINRIVTDHVADILFTTESAGNENLAAEGIPPTRVHYVGNTMIDSLVAVLPRARKRAPAAKTRAGVRNGPYGVMTLHRPSNVDQAGELDRILKAVSIAVEGLPIVFPVHPRTAQQLASRPEGIHAVEPMGYVDFISLMADCRLVLTDSGGMQEESTYLGVPCVTLRKNTERPVTLSEGTNVLAGTDREGILSAVTRQLAVSPRGTQAPALWDGDAASRVVDVLGART